MNYSQRSCAPRTPAIFALAAPLLALTACGGSFSSDKGLTSAAAAVVTPSEASNGSTSAPTGGSTGGGDGRSFFWAIEYTVVGLANGGSVAVVLNGSYAQTISQNLTGPEGAYLFVPGQPANYQGLPVGSVYTLTIGSAPAGEACTVSNGSGTLESDSPPLSASITCTPVSDAAGAEVTHALSGRDSAAVSATPPLRQGAASFSDANGAHWLFGGSGFDRSGTLTEFNDLWRFAPDAGTWQRMAGSGNPPPRSGAVSWADAAGSLWIFGGRHQEADGSIARLNDLWQFVPSTREWTLKSGSSAPSNSPGPRSGAAAWIDSAGNLWLLGGYGFDAVGSLGILNDLWKYTPATDCWTWISGSDFHPLP